LIPSGGGNRPIRTEGSDEQVRCLPVHSVNVRPPSSPDSLLRTFAVRNRLQRSATVCPSPVTRGARPACEPSA